MADAVGFMPNFFIFEKQNHSIITIYTLLPGLLERSLAWPQGLESQFSQYTLHTTSYQVLGKFFMISCFVLEKSPKEDRVKILKDKEDEDNMIEKIGRAW